MVATSPIIRRIRHSPVLPAVALLTAMLLISGQILICCGLNESLSGSIVRMFHSAGIVATIETGTEDPARPHPTCHGHSTAPEMGYASGIFTEAAENAAYDSREICLNEMALPVKAEASGYSAPEELLPAPKSEDQVILALIKKPLAGSWPSRTDTGPPVYLRTLRILV